MVRKVYRRGRGTIEFPFLLSCAVFLLDRRFWILGIRHPLAGIRFDLLAKVPSVVDNVMLVEVKYRGDGRKIRPSEVERFAKEVLLARNAMPKCVVRSCFMTNSTFSDKSLNSANNNEIRTFEKVPLLFKLKKEGKPKKKK